MYIDTSNFSAVTDSDARLWFMDSSKDADILLRNCTVRNLKLSKCGAACLAVRSPGRRGGESGCSVRGWQRVHEGSSRGGPLAGHRPCTQAGCMERWMTPGHRGHCASMASGTLRRGGAAALQRGRVACVAMLCVCGCAATPPVLSRARCHSNRSHCTSARAAQRRRQRNHEARRNSGRVVGPRFFRVRVKGDAKRPAGSGRAVTCTLPLEPPPLH